MLTAEKYRELVSDAFINSWVSAIICHRLLENRTLDLQFAYRQASSLDLAQNSEAYNSIPPMEYVTATTEHTEQLQKDKNISYIASYL